MRVPLLETTIQKAQVHILHFGVDWTSVDLAVRPLFVLDIGHLWHGDIQGRKRGDPCYGPEPTYSNTGLTYLLTPWCRVLPEQLTGMQLVKKFPAFHRT